MNAKRIMDKAIMDNCGQNDLSIITNHVSRKDLTARRIMDRRDHEKRAFPVQIKPLRDKHLPITDKTAGPFKGSVSIIAALGWGGLLDTLPLSWACPELT